MRFAAFAPMASTPSALPSGNATLWSASVAQTQGLETLRRRAVLEGAALQQTSPLALVELQIGEEAPSYEAGTNNFYAFARCNWSSYFAMAVIELGQEVARSVKNLP
jgi:membrane-bound lytic murein transglycosylase B